MPCVEERRREISEGAGTDSDEPCDDHQPPCPCRSAQAFCLATRSGGSARSHARPTRASLLAVKQDGQRPPSSLGARARAGGRTAMDRARGPETARVHHVVLERAQEDAKHRHLKGKGRSGSARGMLQDEGGGGGLRRTHGAVDADVVQRRVRRRVAEVALGPVAEPSVLEHRSQHRGKENEAEGRPEQPAAASARAPGEAVAGSARARLSSPQSGATHDLR